MISYIRNIFTLYKKFILFKLCAGGSLPCSRSTPVQCKQQKRSSQPQIQAPQLPQHHQLCDQVKIHPATLQWNSEVSCGNNGDSAGVVNADDEASLLTFVGSPVSPPFVRAPIEDRSKYEKLAFNADEVSSDSDEEKKKKQASDDRPCKKKRRRKVKAVLDRARKKITDQQKQDHHSQQQRPHEQISSNDPATKAYESDDSIGSASDLKAMNDEDGQEAEDDYEDDDDYPDDAERAKIDETISESVRTCGSSAYHAECESVATHEEPDQRRLRKLKRHHQSQLSQQQHQQLPTIDADPIVGHRYGEQPLLLDDELDPESKPEQIHGDPFVKHQYKVKPLMLNDDSSSDEQMEKPEANQQVIKNGLWKMEEDVFALAPFPRSSSSRKSSREEKNRSSSRIDTPPVMTNDVVASTPVSKSPAVSNNLVDLGVDDDVCDQPQKTPIYFAGGDSLSNPVRKISFKLDDCKEKDLFGSSPFDSNSFSNSFGGFTPPEMNSPSVAVSDQKKVYMAQSYFQAMSPTITSASKYGVVTVNSKVPSVNALTPTTTSTTTVEFREEESKDLFGSIPFDEIASLAPSVVIPQQQRPTSLPLAQSPTFADKTSGSMLCNSAQSANSMMPICNPNYGMPEARITIQNSISPEDIIVSPMSPEPLVTQDSPKHKKHHHEKASKLDKSKYHLINENCSENVNVLPSILPIKMSTKISKSTNKKTSKSSKKSSPAVPVGFNNMSFEDFPSDDNNEHVVGATRAAFEVIREPQKKFGSLKRRSNPFT